MRITFLKYDGSTLTAKWLVMVEGQDKPDEYALKCGDAPRVEFKRALFALATHVGDRCEVHDPDWWKNISPLGFKATWGKDEIETIELLAAKPLRHTDAPLKIRTAKAPVGDDLAIPLHDLIDEVANYMLGDRAQGRLFVEPEPKEGKKRKREAVTA